MMIETERLILRPLEMGDAEVIQRLAGDREIAAVTLNIPHPYPDGAAEAFIASTQQGVRSTFGVLLKETGDFVGCIGIGNDQENRRGELGYWIGKPYWGKGYGTEAARAVVRFGFNELGLNRIYAGHLGGNEASGRIMQKIGMQYEGTQRQHVVKWGETVDLVQYGLLRSEFKP